jgi:hypothetical protein
MLKEAKAAERIEDELRDYRDEQLQDALEDARTEARDEARARLQGEQATEAEWVVLCEEVFAEYAEKAREEVEALVEARRLELQQ